MRFFEESFEDLEVVNEDLPSIRVTAVAVGVSLMLNGRCISGFACTCGAALPTAADATASMQPTAAAAPRCSSTAVAASLW